MGLEAGTYVEDLVATNPPGTDDKRQGDDHIRLIKNVLKNTFKRATKAWAMPGVVAKSASYSILSTDINYTFECDTSIAPFTLTLPALTAADGGWCIYVLKKNVGPNPVFLLPPSGTINGYAKVRRTIPFALTKVVWTGGIWIATRPNEGARIGSTQNFYGAALPDGHLWANGVVFDPANFVELYAVLGGTASTPDCRGRDEVGRDDMGGIAANRVTIGGSGINGTTVFSAGGVEKTTLGITQIPTHSHGGATGSANTDHTHSGTTAADSPNHTHTVAGDTGAATTTSHHHTGIPNLGTLSGAPNAGSFQFAIWGTPTFTTTGDIDVPHTHPISFASGGESTTHTHGFTTGGMSAQHQHAIPGEGGGQPVPIMGPTTICNKILVAE